MQNDHQHKNQINFNLKKEKNMQPRKLPSIKHPVDSKYEYKHDPKNDISINRAGGAPSIFDHGEKLEKLEKLDKLDKNEKENK